MQFLKQESLRVMQCWLDYERVLDDVFMKMLKDYEAQMSPRDTEWETARQQIEYLAKKQTLIDLKKILSSKYE